MKQNMIYLFWIAFAIVALMSGCVNIKTSIPKGEYYRFGDIDSSGCGKKPLKVRLEIEVPSYLNTANILLLRPSGKIEYMENAKWVDLPSVLFKESLQSRALGKCFFFTTIGSESRNILVKIQNFFIQEDFAVISISYLAFEYQQPLFSKDITQKVAIKNRSKEGQIQAMQLAVDGVIDEVIAQIQSRE